MWTTFWDMHSGGGLKEPPFDKIYIEASRKEAVGVFFVKFGHNPERVTCTCCGEDYSLHENETLEQASAYHRGCEYAYFDKDGNEVPQRKAWVSGKGIIAGCTERYVERGKNHKPLEQYLAQSNVLVIRASEITDEQRNTTVPEQGYVWRD